jgi:hypothetical protein
MAFDWQTIAVALIIAAALFYVARRGLARLRSFRAGTKAGAGCETGCGKCGEEVVTSRPTNVLIQISSQRSGRRKSA